jgi:hypothetical protein
MNTEALYRTVTALVAARPDLTAVTDSYRIPDETQRWLAQLHVVVEQAGSVQDEVALRAATRVHARMNGTAGVDDITAVLFRTLYSLEMQLPAAQQGSFIAAGNQFDAFTLLGKVLETAHEQVLFIDPYADEVLLTDYAQMVKEGVRIRVLAAEGRVKPSLAPAAKRWVAQFGDVRHLEVRLAEARAMHDRAIIIDGKEAWIITQSFKDFAKTAHGSIAKTDPDSTALKIEAYHFLWEASAPLQ